MLEGLINLAYYSFGSDTGVLGDFLYTLEANGFFSLLLPFLLIFALIFGILSKIALFDKNKAVAPLIAFVVALIALRFGIVGDFFSVIFPKMAIGLSVLLVVLILIGVFSPGNKSWLTYVLFGIAVIILAIVLIQSAGDVGWRAGYWWYDNWPLVAGAVFVLVIIAIIVGSTSDSKTPAQSIVSALLQPKT